MSNYLMVDYMQGEKLISELSSSNPNHINRIMDELDGALDSFSGVPESGGIIAALNAVCDACTGESKRYEGIAGIMDAYCLEVKTTDIALKEGINKLFQEEYANKDYQYMLEMVKESTNITILNDILSLAEEFGFSVEEMTDIAALESYIQELRKMTSEERKKELEGLASIKNPNKWQSIIIKNTEGKSDNKIEAVIGYAGDGWSLHESYIFASRGERLKIEEIVLLKNKIQKSKYKITKTSAKINKYTAKDNYKYKKIDGWQKGIKKMQGKLDFDAQTGRIKNNGKMVGNVITIFQVGAVLGGNFYDNFVAHDMDGEDFMEDIIVDGVGIGISMGTSIGVAALYAKVGASVGAKAGAVLAGPIGAIVGIFTVGFIGFLYGSIKDDIHNAIEDIEDWWEQCWW